MNRESLAGTGRIYRQAQARVWDNGKFHLQVAGTNVNRDYGLALTLPMPGEGNEALSERAIRRISLAGTGKDYAEIQFVVNRKNTLHVQIEDGSGNRNYGFALDFEVSDEIAAQLAAV